MTSNQRSLNFSALWQPLPGRFRTYMVSQNLRQSPYFPSVGYFLFQIGTHDQLPTWGCNLQCLGSMLGPPCFLSLPPPLPHQQIATSLGGTIAPSISVKNGNLSCNTDFQVTFNNGKGAATKCPFRIEQTERKEPTKTTWSCWCLSSNDYDDYRCRCKVAWPAETMWIQTICYTTFLKHLHSSHFLRRWWGSHRITPMPGPELFKCMVEAPILVGERDQFLVGTKTKNGFSHYVFAKCWRSINKLEIQWTFMCRSLKVQSSFIDGNNLGADAVSDKLPKSMKATLLTITAFLVENWQTLLD